MERVSCSNKAIISDTQMKKSYTEMTDREMIDNKIKITTTTTAETVVAEPQKTIESFKTTTNFFFFTKTGLWVKNG
jgi:hypothetical protein